MFINIIFALIACFSLLMCGSLWVALQKSLKREGKGEEDLRILLKSIHEYQARLSGTTAQNIADASKRRSAFRTHSSWQEEKASLEARDDPEGQRHQKIVAELNNQMPEGTK